MESWSFDWSAGCGVSGYVLRRAPSAAYMSDRPFGHGDEAALVSAAYGSGVRAPEVVGVLAPEDGLGTGYVMRRVAGEVSPSAILADPPRSLLDDLGRELARIHAVPLERVPAAIPLMDTGAALAGLKARFLSYGGDRPAIALAIRWCEDHLPGAAAPVLVHGDYRMGNVMVDAEGLAAVLDWELAHRGDAHEDLAFGCMAVSFFAFLALVSVADLSFAVPATAASYVLQTILARRLLHESISSARWAGVVLVTGGVFLLTL